MSETSKRNLSEVSEASVSPGLIFKKAKQLLSSSSEESFNFDNLENMSFGLTEDKLQAMLASMKSEIVKEVTENFSKYTQTLDLKILELENENIQLKQDNVDLAKKIEDLETKCSEAKCVSLEAKAQAIENEQYSRKSNIKIYGMVENKNENSKKVVIDMCKKDLKLDIREKDIDAAHRVGKSNKNNKYSRSMIVRFVRRDTKFEIMRNRKKLKGSGVVVADDLCQEIIKVYNRVRNDPRVKDAWTWFGKIFVKDEGGKIHKVSYGQKSGRCYRCRTYSK